MKKRETPDREATPRSQDVGRIDVQQSTHLIQTASRSSPAPWENYVYSLTGGSAAPRLDGGDYMVGDTRIVARLARRPWEAYVPASETHCVTAYLEGFSRGHSSVGGRSQVADRPPGSVSVSPLGTHGLRRTDAPYTVSSVFLTDARLQACADELMGGRTVELLSRLGVGDTKMFSIVRMLSDEIASRRPMTGMFVEQLLDLLCLQLIRAHSSDAARLQTVHTGGLTSTQVRRVTYYIASQLDRDFTLDDLAGVVGLSKFHFCNAFRVATGFTPHQWLLTMRVDAAKKLLADKRVSIAAIAASVGYRSPSAFTAAFKRVVGHTPVAFREGQ